MQAIKNITAHADYREAVAKLDSYREALADAIATGRNQIFLSASKAQAHIFKQYLPRLGSNIQPEEGKY
mgnify:CR=1 FL=1